MTRRVTLASLLTLLGVALLCAAAALDAAGRPSPRAAHPAILVTRLPPPGAGPTQPEATGSAPLAPSLFDPTATPVPADLVNGSPYLPPAAPASPTLASPARLMVPSLSLNESIVTIPVINGDWDISQLGTHIGWLSTTGSHPGDALAMVFIGHYTIAAATKGALGDLWHARPGDLVIYETGGLDYLYSITSMKTVGPNAVGQLYVNDGRQLLLVTCANWDYLEFRYTNRLVVQAQQVRQERTQ